MTQPLPPSSVPKPSRDGPRRNEKSGKSRAPDVAKVACCLIYGREGGYLMQKQTRQSKMDLLDGGLIY